MSGLVIKEYGGYGQEYLLKAGNKIIKFCDTLKEAEECKAIIDACYQTEPANELDECKNIIKNKYRDSGYKAGLSLAPAIAAVCAEFGEKYSSVLMAYADMLQKEYELFGKV